MIQRHAASIARELRKSYPAIAITGPRQSGKTTLAKEIGRDLPYVDFESPLERAEFATDPLGFFRRFPDGGVIDEVQHVPDLLSFLKVQIDAKRIPGRWILTGSRQLELERGISESLAGRVARMELLPLSYAEVQPAGRAPRSLAEAVFRGGYPVLFQTDHPVDPVRWLEDYLSAVIDRDIAHLLGVKNRSAFDRFVRLCAARTGQILNAAELGRDAGIDGKTVESWLSVLEACYLIYRLRPHHRNFSKRMIKSPKLYFIDTGVVCRLLHISDLNQAMSHPQWGALVETWCIGEALKARLNRGLRPNAWYWRSSDGVEVDLLFEIGQALHPLEIKAAVTPQRNDVANLVKLRGLSARDAEVTIAPGSVIYGGDEHRPVGEDRFVPWSSIAEAVPEAP